MTLHNLSRLSPDHMWHSPTQIPKKLVTNTKCKRKGEICIFSQRPHEHRHDCVCAGSRSLHPLNFRGERECASAGQVRPCHSSNTCARYPSMSCFHLRRLVLLSGTCKWARPCVCSTSSSNWFLLIARHRPSEANTRYRRAGGASSDRRRLHGATHRLGRQHVEESTEISLCLDGE
jgi:hypothetical protein